MLRCRVPATRADRLVAPGEDGPWLTLQFSSHPLHGTSNAVDRTHDLRLDHELRMDVGQAVAGPSVTRIRSWRQLC